MLNIEDFLKYLTFERNYSQRTIGEYSEDLHGFEQFYKKLDDELSWENIDTDVVRDWVEYMMDKGNTATSVNRRLSALRSFYRYALKRGFVENDPTYKLQGPKRKKPLPQFLKEAEMDTLLVPEMWGNTYKDVLARTIILTFYSTGIRVSELVGLNNQRIIPFGKELEEQIDTYQKLRNDEIGEQEALFVTAKGERITTAQVRTMVKANLAKVSTLKKKSPHVLRHTFATAMLNNKAGLESVKKLLGHESIVTTEVYTHVTFEQLKKAYNEAHPRA